MPRALATSLTALALLVLGTAGASAQTAAPGLITTHKLSAALGGIGVSGARGGQLDEECARVARAKIKGRMK